MYVYILENQFKKHYIGCTSNLEKRLLRHNSGSNKSTKLGRPWYIIYNEVYKTKRDALKREKQIKSYKGGMAFKELIKRKCRLAPPSTGPLLKPWAGRA